MLRINLGLILLITPAFADPAMRWPVLVRAEGTILINDKPAPELIGQAVVKEDFVVRTTGGRAEIKLRENGKLVLGPNTAVRIIDNRPFSSSKFEVLGGSVFLATGNQSGNIVDCENTMTLSDDGIFRINVVPDAPQGQKFCLLQVRAGAASVPLATVTAVLTAGKSISLNRRCGDMIPTLTFGLEKPDDLDQWSRGSR